MDMSIDIGFEVLPQILEMPIKRSGLDKPTKRILKSQIREFVLGTEYAVELSNEVKKENNNNNK